MATIYNKTALKKVKKDEIIQMFLDLQAQRINDSMDEAVEKCCNNAIEEVVEGLKKENEKLKEFIQNMDKRKVGILCKKLKEENEKLKKFKSDVIDALQFDDDLDDEDYISSIKEMEEQYDINR